MGGRHCRSEPLSSLPRWPACVPTNSNLTSLHEGARQQSSCMSCCPPKEELWEFLLLSNILQNTSPHTQIFKRCEGFDLGGEILHSLLFLILMVPTRGSTLTCRDTVPAAKSNTTASSEKLCSCFLTLCHPILTKNPYTKSIT